MHPASGGPCQGIRNSIPELERLGVNNEVVCLDDPAEPFIKKDPFLITALGPGKGPWCYSEKLIPWLIDNLYRFDAVIVHGLWLFNGYATYKAMRHLKSNSKKSYIKEKLPKLFVMPHGMLDPYFQHATGRRLKALRNWVYWKIIESKLISKSNGVLFTSETELLLAKETFIPYKPKKELNVGYGIPAPPNVNDVNSNLFFNKFPLLRNTRYILFLSRVHEKKGVDLLINAYETIAKSRTISSQNRKGQKYSGNTEILQQEELPLLVIAGPGMETAYGQKIQQLVQNSKYLQDVVIFAGMLNGDTKWSAFYNCDAFVLPSHQENFGIAVVEALACGKPVLISNQVNIWREIEHDGAGLIAANTQQGTFELLDQWNNMSDNQKTEMSNEAKNCYERNFAIGPAAKRFCKVMEN